MGRALEKEHDIAGRGLRLLPISSAAARKQATPCAPDTAQERAAVDHGVLGLVAAAGLPLH